MTPYLQLVTIGATAAILIVLTLLVIALFGKRRAHF